MTILQLLQETFSDPSMYGYMGVGSVSLGIGVWLSSVFIVIPIHFIFR